AHADRAFPVIQDPEWFGISAHRRPNPRHRLNRPFIQASPEGVALLAWGTKGVRMELRARRLSGFFPLLALGVAAAWFLGHAHIRAAHAADSAITGQPVPDQPVPNPAPPPPKQPDGKTPLPPDQAARLAFVQMTTSHGDIYLE